MIWHPFTSQAEPHEALKIVRAEQEFLFDTEGRRYIDAIASWWTVIHGHNQPKIVRAITDQLQQLDHVMLAGFTHEPAEQLAAELLAVTNRQFSHVFYSDNGSTAVEVMLKLALQYWSNLGESKRQVFVRFDAAYHGDTFGAMSVAAPSLFTQPFSRQLFETRTFRYPQSADDESFFAAWEQFLAEQGDTLAGVIIEPLIAAAGGMVFQEEAALRRLCEAARQRQVLLLFDEVFTGLGRTGSFCAFQKAQVVPDLLSLAKGLTGGTLPLAVTLVSAQIHSAYVSSDPAHTFYHGHTMTGNPPGCAAALASLGLFRAENRLAQVMQLEGKMQQHWKSITERHAGKVEQVRVMGAVSAGNLVSTSEQAGYAFSWSQRLRQESIRLGVVLRPLGNVLYMTPPYNISDESLAQVFSVIDQLLTQYEP